MYHQEEEVTHDAADVTTQSDGGTYFFYIEDVSHPCHHHRHQQQKGDEENSEVCSEFLYGQVGHADEDQAWSVLSNSFFLAGGTCYLILSLWDLHTPPSLCYQCKSSACCCVGTFLKLV
jgi:hypothetical protein